MNSFSLAELERIKILTITALLSDEDLVGRLVLKGGNALNLVYNISTRGSIDIDFSMQKDFSDLGLAVLKSRIETLLIEEFKNNDLIVFDVLVVEKPSVIEDEVKKFWGGYKVEFKVIDAAKAIIAGESIKSLRNYAIPLNPNGSTKFTIDISKYEYVAKSTMRDLEGNSLLVYTPAMLVLEKLRALCQQVPEYKTIVKRMTPKSRSRDFFDIYNLTTSFNINFATEESIDLARHIFAAKLVPLHFVKKIPEQYEFHASGWESVLQTIPHRDGVLGFDFYFNQVMAALLFLGEVDQNPLG